MSLRLTRRTALAMGGSVAMGATVSAQAPYPTSTIRLVMGFPPGGPTDVYGRLVAQRLTEILGQQVIVDNKPGAAGNIASELVANAKPDGYTLLFGTSIMAIVPALYPTLPYDPLKSFAMVAHVSTVPMILVTPADGAKTTEELVAMLKREPGKYSYPSPGNGSLIHLTSLLFAQRAGADAMHVPYRGSAPAMQDTLAGRHAYQFDTLGSSKGFLDSGRLRLLGVATEKRVAAMKDVPTVQERAGFPFTSYTWNVVFAPAGTPRPIVERLNKAINQALSSPAFIDRAAAMAIDVVADSTPETADHFYREQLAFWGPITKASGAKVE